MTGRDVTSTSGAVGESDRELAGRLLGLLAPCDAVEAIGTVILGEPFAKSRPRFSADGRAYKPQEDKDAEDTTAWTLRRVFRTRLTGNVAVAARFFRSSRQVVDVDNLLKHLCDAANGIAWVDDSQVTALYGSVELDPARPRTVVVIAPHRSTMLRGTDSPPAPRSRSGRKASR